MPRLLLIIFVVVTIGGTLSACDSVDAPPRDLSLSDLAIRNDIRIGTAVAPGLVSDRFATDLIVREFNSITPEFAMTFSNVRPTIDLQNWTEADEIVDFAQSNGMAVRGQTLVQQDLNPPWLTQQVWSRAQMIEHMRQHITTTAQRYRGRIAAWDVVGEAFAQDGSLLNTIWLERIGPEYIEMAFDFAHLADPEARLFLNESGAEGRGEKSDGVYNFVRQLREKGIPVHGVGMQMHVSVDFPPSAADVAWNMNRLRELGVEVHITQMDVRMPLPATAENLERQAEIYHEMLAVCLDAPNCRSFTMWGFSDLHSWIPDHFPGQGAALIFDEAFHPKPAYHALLRAFD